MKEESASTAPHSESKPSNMKKQRQSAVTSDHQDLLQKLVGKRRAASLKWKNPKVQRKEQQEIQRKLQRDTHREMLREALRKIQTPKTNSDK